MNLSGKRFLVVGLGKSGVGAARLLASAGARVVGNDLRTREALGEDAAALEALGVSLALGAHDPAQFLAAEHIVVSPGVPPLAALAAADAAGIPISSEIELASWWMRGTVVAITGTNGKSTVTTLVGEMCKATGRPTFVGGNLGPPLTDVVGTPAAEPGGFVVVEVSSFQLERVRRFRADVAVLLNVTDDHLDRYPSFDAYAAAKGRVFERQTAADAAVIPADDPLVARLAEAGAGRTLRFASGAVADGDVSLQAGALVDAASGLRFPVASLKILGRHNVANAAASMLAARAAGVEGAAIESALRAFTGLPHRMQFVAARAGVRYYDDSKATNVGATVAALDGLAGEAGKVVLLAGGRDKGGSYAPLVDRLVSRGRAVVLLGEAAPLIEGALAGSPVERVRAASMEDAVREARRLATPGDVVLLAPACSSFDMFRSYAERGDAFQRAVLALPEEAP